MPTGIGTFVGMLIVQKLIKKTDPIKVYWIFGIYSLIANALAFGAESVVRNDDSDDADRK